MAITCCGNSTSLDEDNADLLKLLIKEGYLEKDEDGKFCRRAARRSPHREQGP